MADEQATTLDPAPAPYSDDLVDKALDHVDQREGYASRAEVILATEVRWLREVRTERNALRAELARLRPVVDAARAWTEGRAPSSAVYEAAVQARWLGSTAQPAEPGYERIADAIANALMAADREVVVTAGERPDASPTLTLARVLDKAGLIDWNAFTEEEGVMGSTSGPYASPDPTTGPHAQPDTGTSVDEAVIVLHARVLDPSNPEGGAIALLLARLDELEAIEKRAIDMRDSSVDLGDWRIAAKHILGEAS